MKTALVTGANRGIGHEIAKQLVAKGFHVIAVGRDRQKLEQAAKDFDGKVEARVCDISSLSDCRALASFLRDKMGQLDVLVNNAGVMGNTKALDFDMEQMRSVLDINLMGAIHLTGAVWPLLIKSKDARVINVSSGMGELGDMTLGGYAPYRLSKWSLNGWTMLMAGEAPDNVRINAMCPGWVQTDMGGASATRPVEKGAETAVWLATASDIPQGKFLRDKEVIDW